MKSVLDRIHRLKKYTEQCAQMDLAEAETIAEAQAQRVSRANFLVEDSYANCGASIGDIAQHHAFALRTEMTRRKDEAQLVMMRREVSDKRKDVIAASVDKKVVELVAEHRASEQLQNAARKTQRQLDEAALQVWIRRTV